MIGLPAQAGAGGATTIVQFILAMAGSGVLVATVQGLFTRGRTRAEVDSTGALATKTITDAAALIVANLQTDNASLRAEIASLRAEITRLHLWREQAERNFEAHQRWDETIVVAIRDCTDQHQWPNVAGRIGDPPPLRPTNL